MASRLIIKRTGITLRLPHVGSGRQLISCRRVVPTCDRACFGSLGRLSSRIC